MTGLSFLQVKTLLWIYWAYVCCYLLRKNFPLIMPSLDGEGILSVAQAGIAMSSFELVVGAFKMYGGVLVDRHSNPARLLSMCLLVAGGSSLLLQGVLWSSKIFNSSTPLTLAYVPLVAAFWCLNGMGQAIAWPALARVFLYWFPDPSQRGFWYSVLSTNQNVGGTLAPKLYPVLIASFGWSVALFGPALLTLVFAFAMSLSLISRPQEKQQQYKENGLVSKSDTRAVRRDDDEDEDGKIAVARKCPKSMGETRIAEKKSDAPGFFEAASYLFKQPFFWCLCAGYAPISVIRISLATWTPVIFEASGMTLHDAAQCIVALECGAFVGSLCGGYLSDLLFRGRRGPIMTIFSGLCLPLGLCIGAVMNSDSSGGAVVEWTNELLRATTTSFGFGNGDHDDDRAKLGPLLVLYFATGFASFPPHMLTGLLARELSPENMRSTAGCLAKATAQTGAVLAGWPLQRLSETYGWVCVSYAIAISGLFAMLGYAPLWGKVVPPRGGKEKVA